MVIDQKKVMQQQQKYSLKKVMQQSNCNILLHNYHALITLYVGKEDDTLNHCFQSSLVCEFSAPLFSLTHLATQFEGERGEMVIFESDKQSNTSFISPKSNHFFSCCCFYFLYKKNDFWRHCSHLYMKLYSLLRKKEEEMCSPISILCSATTYTFHK